MKLRLGKQQMRKKIIGLGISTPNTILTNHSTELNISWLEWGINTHGLNIYTHTNIYTSIVSHIFISSNSMSWLMVIWTELHIIPWCKSILPMLLTLSHQGPSCRSAQKVLLFFQGVLTLCIIYSRIT